MISSPSYLLSLDIGTTSIGYCVFSINEKNQPTQLLDVGVRIFSDGREPKSQEPLSVQRRLARRQRRNRDRGQNRVRRLVKELIDVGLLPECDEERANVFSKICPYESRALAARRKVEDYKLGRALLHLGRRRGFKSNRLSSDREESAFVNKIESLRAMLGEQTLGEYLFEKLSANNKKLEQGKKEELVAVRFKGDETAFYPDRDMYRLEFAQIKRSQLSRLTEEHWNMLEETIFWQYPLKPIEKGKCRFYPGESRAPTDLPLSHQFRICQEVNNLSYMSNGEQHSLDERQRVHVLGLLNKKKTLTFKGLCREKDEHKAPIFPDDAVFNLDTQARKGKLHGNVTLINLSKEEYLGDLALEMPEDKLNELVAHLIDPIKIIDGNKVIEELDETKKWVRDRLPELSNEQVENLCHYRFKRSTASVSLKFMGQVVPLMMQKPLKYFEAVRLVENEYGVHFHHSDFRSENFFVELPYYGEALPDSVWGAFNEADANKSEQERDNDAYTFGKIANPTVHLALNQLRYVVNKIVKARGGTPSRIHVELTRELKNSKEARKRIEKANSENRLRNDRIKNFLSSECNIPNPSREEIVKIKLWEELGTQGARFCVFTGRPISARQLFDGTVEVEHIVPFSRCYDDGFSNKTLAFKSINHAKGNKTPHEAFGSAGSEYRIMLKRALKCFGQTAKFERFKEGAFDKFYGLDKGGNLIERQLNDTRYISKLSRHYLGTLIGIDNVIPVNGAITSKLRDVWQLNQYKDRKKGHYRDDHRHHIVDAFVVGLTNNVLVRAINTRSSRDLDSRPTVFGLLKAKAPPIDKLRSELYQQLDKVVASFKPDHGLQGSMFNDTAYGIKNIEGGQRLTTRKCFTNLSIDELFQIKDKTIRQTFFKKIASRGDIENKRELLKEYDEKANFENDKATFSAQYGCKKIRINVLNNSVERIKSSPHKGYALNAYAFAEVWKIPMKDRKTGDWVSKYEGVFVPYAKVLHHKNNPGAYRPHPAAKKLMTLFKNDTVRMVEKETGECSFWRIAGYSAGQNKLDIQPNLLSGKLKQNFKSVNALFGCYRVSKI